MSENLTNEECADFVVPIELMSEEDVKLHFITPAIRDKWNCAKVLMEKQITDGRVNINGNFAVRERPRRVDYLLYTRDNYPIAVVEAKDATKSLGDGIQQAMKYAQMLDLPFAYASNGSAFLEHDFLTGKETELKLTEFPTEQELLSRIEKARVAKSAPSLTCSVDKIATQSYYSGADTNKPRYYQRIAINRTLDAISRGQQRLLLVMATGTGKTYTAFQIVHRLIASKTVSKVLYLADRNLLVDQSIQQDFKPLKKVIHKVDSSEDKKDRAKLHSYQVYFSLYQQLIGAEGEEHFRNLFPPDFFDLIIVDECHRGSARDDGLWHIILKYFNKAKHLGMTATPRETKYVSNLTYFGEPIYTYSLREGIDDGFLAPFKVINVTTDISEGWRPNYGQRDANGVLIPDRVYNNSDFDYNIIIQDRTDQIAREITTYLAQTDRFAKTIVFCADEDAALRMRQALIKYNADMVKEHPDYIMRITSSDIEGKSMLSYFISVGAKFPVIATTSKLLSTGADCKMTKLIVLDQNIQSMTEFKQIIGRGTRLREEDGKKSFTVLDFRNVTRLFHDPEWDGPIEVINPPKSVVPPGGGETPPLPPDPPGPMPEPRPPKLIVTRDGCKVEIINKRVYVYDSNGRRLRQESLIDYTKESIRGNFATLNAFIHDWSAKDKKKEISELLRERGLDLEELKRDQDLADVDDFDFICHVAYDQKPLTRRERADNVKKRDFLSRYSGDARAVLDALLERYKDSGVYEIENPTILELDPFRAFGSPGKIAEIFGGREAYRQAVKELKNELYSQEAV